MKYVKLKIQLLYTDISRTIVVPDSWTLEMLHYAIQAAFGWEDCHLWAFSAGRDDEIVPQGELRKNHSDVFCSCRRRAANRVKVCDCFPEKGAKLDYEYDFGDSWTHRITRMADPKVDEVACVKTTGVMGIEDIGGSGGLMNFIYDLREYDANPKRKPDDGFMEMLEWMECEDEEERKRVLMEPTAEQVTQLIRDALGL